MPLNLLKKYPELLILNDYSANEREKSLRGVFNRDIVDNATLNFQGKKIYPIKADGSLDLDREFKHLTTEEFEEVDDGGKKRAVRRYDPYRSERLHWIRTHLEEDVRDGNIEVFSISERRNRSNVIRTYIYNTTRKYVVVLEPQRRIPKSYYLLTAYYLNKEYGEKMLKKKMRARLDEVL